MKTRVNSINKGKRYERDVAKYLTQITGTSHSRVPQSGGMATTKKLHNFVGDVISNEVLNGDAKQEYIIECKSTKSPIEIFELLRNKSKLAVFLKQSIEEGEQIKKPWFLFVKCNRRQWLCFCDLTQNAKELEKIYNIQGCVLQLPYITSKMLSVKIIE